MALLSIAMIAAAFVADIALGAGKDVLGPVQLIPALDLSKATATTAVLPTSRFYDNFAFQINIPATTTPAAGSYYIEASEDYNPNTNTAGNWTPLTFASTGAVWAQSSPLAASSGAVFYAATPAAVFYREVIQTGAAYLRVRYVPTTTAAATAVVWASGHAL